MSHIQRRTFLRSSTALLGLPLLESFGPTRVLAAGPQTAPAKRMVFLGLGWGVTKESWYPKVSQAGGDYDLPPGLAPLARHKKDFTVIQNLQHQYSDQAHWGSTFWLTGANRFAIPGQSFHNTVSVDQVAAEAFGRETRFRSMQLGCRDIDGHGPGLSLAWSRSGKPLSGLNTPVEAFHKMFSAEDVPLNVRQDQIAEQRSILDAVSSEAKSVSGKLNTHDRDKLDEYLQSIRDIEVRLAKEEQWLDIPKRQPDPAVKQPQGHLEGYDEVKMMYDLMVSAMQVDATRVFTYRLPGNSFIRSFGATISAHNMSHYDRASRQEVSATRDRKHAELLAYFFDRLKKTREPDGSTLFDNTVIVFGSNISSIHNLTNCPTLIAGGGAGIRHGRHLVMDDPRTPLCNLWLSLLQGVGIKVDSHGDSTGRLAQL